MNRLLTLIIAVAGLLPLCGTIAQAESGPINKDSAAFYVNLSREDSAARKYIAAWTHLETAAKYDPRNADIQLFLADIFMKIPHKESKAIVALETACQLNPTDYTTQWRLVKIHFNYNRYEKVIELLPALHSHLQTPGWAFMVGKSYYSIQLRNVGKAIEYLEISLKEDPANAEAAYLIGRMYLSMENYKDAIPYYQRALSIDSLSQPIRTSELAQALLADGQYDLSVKTFWKAIDRGCRADDNLFGNMADAYASAGKMSEAIQLLKEMLNRRPTDIGLLNALADVYNRSSKYEEAITCWEKVDNIAGSDNKVRAIAIYHMGSAYVKLGHEEEGNRLRDRAINMDPSLNVLKHVHMN